MTSQKNNRFPGLFHFIALMILIAASSAGIINMLHEIKDEQTELRQTLVEIKKATTPKKEVNYGASFNWIKKNAEKLAQYAKEDSAKGLVTYSVVGDSIFAARRGVIFEGVFSEGGLIKMIEYPEMEVTVLKGPTLLSLEEGLENLVYQKENE